MRYFTALNLHCQAALQIVLIYTTSSMCHFYFILYNIEQKDRTLCSDIEGRQLPEGCQVAEHGASREVLEP